VNGEEALDAPFLRLESQLLKVLTEEFRLQDFLGFFQHADLSVQPAQILN